MWLKYTCADASRRAYVCVSVQSVIPEDHVPDEKGRVRFAIRMSMTACCGACPRSAPCWGSECGTAGRSADCTDWRTWAPAKWSQSGHHRTARTDPACALDSWSRGRRSGLFHKNWNTKEIHIIIKQMYFFHSFKKINKWMCITFLIIFNCNLCKFYIKMNVSFELKSWKFKTKII